MIRSWRFITMTGAAQPLFGDVLTAAFSNRAVNGLYQATVADTTKYQVGDRVLFGFGQTNPNLLMVDQIVSATVLGLASEGGAAVASWINGSQLCLSIACAQVIAQSKAANAASAYVGSDSTVTNVPGGSAFGEVVVGNYWNYGGAPYNVVRTSELWIAGTASDKFGISALVV